MHYIKYPDTKRPYSWGDDQLEKLWDDLIEAQITESLIIFWGQ